jgi:O-acetyl-ADP-ribose deacetylase (regulator of RNase III)
MKIKIVDLNPNIVAAMAARFKDEHQVEVIHGSITDQVDACVWVTPTNARGNMSGGVDLAIKNWIGQGLENSLKGTIIAQFGGLLPVGRAVVTDVRPLNHLARPMFVISTPTMEGESDDLRRTKNAAMAMAAAFQALYSVMDKSDVQIESVAIPGLGSGTGKMSPETCAELMFVGYTLFRRRRYENFEAMIEELYMELAQTGKPEIAAVLAKDVLQELAPQAWLPGDPASGADDVDMVGGHPASAVKMTFDPNTGELGMEVPVTQEVKIVKATFEVDAPAFDTPKVFNLGTPLDL